MTTFLSKTLGEHAEAVRVAAAMLARVGPPAYEDALGSVIAAYEAERRARVAAEARVRELEAIVGNARSVCCSAAVRCGRCGADQRYEVGHG